MAFSNGNRKIKKLMILIVFCCLSLSILIFCGIYIAHSIAFSRADYDKYDAAHYLLYEDIDAKKYPREQRYIQSGENTISAFYYPAKESKGLIVVAPGHRDSSDIKLYEICYFVDSGYSVICLDYTGCYSSSGDSMNGYSQCVYDLDALLDNIEADDQFQNMPVYLFGHSMGGYAVSAVLQYGHHIEKVISASGFDTPQEQWQYSIKRYTGVFYPIIQPFNTLFINIKYGNDKELSAIDGINSVTIPVLIISAENDVYYGGFSPLYARQNEIVNPNCTFVLMNTENHNGHYDYFLTDAALAYRDNNPSILIDKELYMEHDEHIMNMLIEFLEDK